MKTWWGGRRQAASARLGREQRPQRRRQPTRPRGAVDRAVPVVGGQRIQDAGGQGHRVAAGLAVHARPGAGADWSAAPPM